jgi:hypothetical protein
VLVIVIKPVLLQALLAAVRPGFVDTIRAYGFVALMTMASLAQTLCWSQAEMYARRYVVLLLK